MVDFRYVGKLRFWCQKVLPLVYDDSLSYYEALCKICAKLNETIEQLNALADDVTELEGRVSKNEADIQRLKDTYGRLEALVEQFLIDVEARFNELEGLLTARIDLLSRRVDNKLDDVDRRLANAENKIDTEIARMKADFDLQTVRLDRRIDELTLQLQGLINARLEQLDKEFRAVINQQIIVLHEEIERVEGEVKAWVEAKLEEFLRNLPDVQNVLVYDPTSDRTELVKIQVAIDNIFFKYRYGSLTAHELDHLNYNCEQLDHFFVDYVPRGLTCYQWDILARKYVWTDPKVMTYHPKTGALVLDREVDIFNTDLLRVAGSWNCTEFDEMLPDVNTFEALELSAYVVDWFSNSRIA